MTALSDEQAAYLALACTPGIGHHRLRAVLQAFGTPLGAISAPFAFLRAVPGISTACATALSTASLASGHALCQAATRAGGSVLFPDDPDFPALLHEIPDPPTVLFVAGNRELLQRPAVAIIGSRDHSLYGAEVARGVAATAVAAGLTVVSGMARGLDAVAHAAALDHGGTTIGVLGNGLGVVYPAANRALYQRVVADGLLLTEFPPGERPSAGSFQRRNRLISGLARATVVVEAAERSGTLVTVSAALEQGRDVLAVPGPITSPLSIGTNRLIRDGASPYLEPDDLLRHYPEVQPGTVVTRTPVEPALAPLPPGLTDSARRVADLLDSTLTPIDNLAEQAGRPVAELLAALCELEIAGVVEQEAGARFRRL